jgi:hypothetical protein
LEGLEKQANQIEVDFTNSELMARLAEALKTYCICGGKDDDTFMIQCDDCEDWFHGRCVHVEVRTGVSGVTLRHCNCARTRLSNYHLSGSQEFKGIECIEKAVEEMIFVCPRCCDKRGKAYRFHPEYRRPEGTSQPTAMLVYPSTDVLSP